MVVVCVNEKVLGALVSEEYVTLQEISWRKTCKIWYFNKTELCHIFIMKLYY